MTDNHPTYQLGDDFNERLDKFVAKFIKDGFEYFKQEFDRVDRFVEMARCQALQGNNREDNDLRVNPKEKYLLELISFKMYDELNRAEFNRRKNTLIIMPDCLSIHEKACDKVELEFGSVCRRCQADCQAAQITDLAAKYKCKVLFSKRSLEKQLKHHADKMGDMAVIGIACIMMLANGMRTAHEIDVPARGVLLNFTGCDHWNEKPFASEFTLKSLEKILKEKYGDLD